MKHKPKQGICSLDPLYSLRGSNLSKNLSLKKIIVFELLLSILKILWDVIHPNQQNICQSVDRDITDAMS